MDKVEADGNCWTSMTIRIGSTISTVTQNTTADGNDDCVGKSNAFAQIFRDLGYEVSDQITIYG